MLYAFVLAQPTDDIVIKTWATGGVYGDDFEEVPCRRPQLHRLHRLTRHRHCFELEDTLDDLIARARRRPHHEGLETVPVARQAKTVAV